MRFAGLIFALGFSATSLAGIGQEQAKPAGQIKPAAQADPYRDEAIVFERSETTYKMHADGTGERDIHAVLRIQSEGAAQQFGVLSFAYASANETPVIKFVRVHKPDGTVVETPVADAIDMPTEVTREAPLYSDLKEKHLPVRSLSPGDTLEYEVDTTINKAEAPGQFWGAMHFTAPGTVVVLAEMLTLEVPKDKYVQVWSPNHKPTVTEHDGTRTYSWNVAQLVTAPKRTGDDSAKTALPKDPDEDSEGRKVPSVAWTTFHSWTEVGDWYRSLALKQAEPNDAVRARADEITKNAKTPDEQTRAIYEYVSSQTRYIGIDFGIGRYQPHAAADVLANQYGDCKDKDTLLESLLRAKGIATAPALIGVGIAPVPEVPSPAVFNHVITTVNLPSGRIWLDSTPLAAPYQYLLAVIRDQKALVVPAEGAAALEATPANAPYPFTAAFEAEGALDADGKLTAKMTATYHDDDEIVVRGLARSVAPAEWDKVSQFVSVNTGFGGTTSNTSFKNDADSSQPIVLTYDYARHPFGDWDNRRIVPLFPALEFSALDSDSTAPQNDIQLGAPRILTAVSRIKLPDGYHTDLPDPIHVKTDFATFDKTYRFEGDEIVVERKIAVLKSKIPKSNWEQYQKFTRDISLDGEAWIQLIPPQKKLAVVTVVPAGPVKESKTDKGSVTVHLNAEQPSAPKVASAAPPSDASPTELMNLVGEKMKAQDWSGARETLDEVKAKNPNQKGLWGAYGFLAELVDRNQEEAKADFSKELANDPDNERLVSMLASVEDKSGDSEAARQTIQKFLDHHPENLPLSLYLVSLENKSGDYSAGLKTLETAADQNPDNRTVRAQLSDEFVRLNRMEEAAAAAKSALDGTDDPEVLNDAAYTLSETGLNLDIAEDASRKSIAAQEEKTATMTTAEANSNAFAQANLLVASWDTLGWILYREGKFDEAEPWLVSAWRASLRAEVGDHLAQLYEAQGKRLAAIETYTLAQAASAPPALPPPPDVRKHIEDAIARLNIASAKGDPNKNRALAAAHTTQTLQDLRTYKVQRPAGASGWGTFRLEITTAGVIESQQMSGEQHLASVKPAIDAMKFPGLLPPASKAHLLRSAVVSCSMGTTCDVVLVPDGGLQTEQQ